MIERIREDVRRYWKACLLFVFIYIGMRLVFGTTCLSQLLVGLPCPFCGTTRALLLALSLHFREAWQMHPLFPFVAAGVPLFFWDRYDGRLHKHHVFLIYLGALMAAATVLYVYRMLNLFPDAEPMTRWTSNLLSYIMHSINERGQ